MPFEADGFISYAHLDNVGLSEDHKGWVANLHRALEVRLRQLLGRQVEIWRDPKLQGNDMLNDALAAKLESAAALIPIVSPLYVNSEWGRKELEAFCRAAERQGGLCVEEKCRIFKILKTPVPLDQHPAALRSLIGYEFFTVDPDTGRHREMDELFGPEAARDFWTKLDDVAHDMSRLLGMLHTSAEEERAAGTIVYLAEVTADLKPQREAIKRDLQQHGYTVLPNRALPLAAAELASAVREDLARSRLSIHMLGRTYGLVPEGGFASLPEIQHELAVERARAGGFARLVWIAPALQVLDDRQRKVLDRIRMDWRIEQGADLLETPFEDLKPVISSRLERARAPHPHTAMPPKGFTSPQVYLLHDIRDAAAVTPWADFLFQHAEVVQPIFDGDEADVREFHEENLRTCDGALIFYGAGNEFWLRRKLGELQKSAGYGRTKPWPVVGVCLAPPRTPEKARFRTRNAMVIDQWEGFSPDRLQPFVAALRVSGGEHHRDGARDAG
jgi:hypothetical protein